MFNMRYVPTNIVSSFLFFSHYSDSICGFIPLAPQSVFEEFIYIYIYISVWIVNKPLIAFNVDSIITVFIVQFITTKNIKP